MSLEFGQVVETIKGEIGIILELPPEEIDENENFLSMGISSIQAVKLINTVKKKLDTELNPAVIFEYQTIKELAEYLIEEHNK